MVNKIIGDIEHIGIAVKDIYEAEKMYCILGYQKLHDGILEDDMRGVKVCFLKKGLQKIELVAPLKEEEKSPVDKFNNLKIGYAMYHICYRVENIKEAISYLKDNGYMQIEEISIAQLMENKREVYMFQRKMGLIELLEDKNE